MKAIPGCGIVNRAFLPALTTRVLRSQTKRLTPTTTAPRFGKGAKVTKRRKRLDPWYPKRKVNKNPEPRAPPPTHSTCRICISHLPSSEFIRWVTPRRAKFSNGLDAPSHCIPHLARNPTRRNVDPVCKTCIGSFMAARLDTLGVRRVSVGCLEPGCETIWPWELVMRYFPTDKLEAYNLASFDVWCNDTELFTCLSPACSAVGLLDYSAPGYPQVQCNACAFRSCTVCLIPWHTNQTCAEVSATAINAQMSDPEKQTLELMQSKDGKRCPNCQLVIEKIGGCHSMFCPSCKKYFNWETAASAVPGTKKALPASIQVCEVDRQEGRLPDVTEIVRSREELDGGALDFFGFDQFLIEDTGLGVNLWGAFQLPDEDNADL